MSKNVKRLFTQFTPTHYELHVDIASDKQSFTGRVILSGRKTGRPSKRITLHAKHLSITKAEIEKIDKKNGHQSVQISRMIVHKTYEELRLHSEETIFPGEYQLTVSFAGKITRNMEGIYPCFYSIDGKEHQLIASQFESHHAREVFPCIDEPEAKATFQLSLTHDKNEIALSNTPVLKETTKAQRTTTTFDTTPLMSTYLLAFVVGDLAYKEAKSSRGVVLRAYATKNQVDHVDFALDTAVKALDFYENYYDIPFPLPKCDFVALPDFASGAMENWGLITFREQCMLYDPEHTSLPTKQYVAIVVCHELTHQWFGNLVTMRWWTDLWLNEGFASWMEYLAVDTLFPEWQMWTQFASDDQQAALKADSLEHTHPIEVAVKHPDEIRTIFDTISYMKGASVIHMLQHFLGADMFRDGLRHYLKTHAYKNTDTIDLWQALEDVSKKPVKDFMHAWTSQSGYPLVAVDEKDDHIIVSQKRFISNPKSPAREDTTVWPIPLHVSGASVDIVRKQRTNVAIKKPLIKLNDGQAGLYRVDYSHTIQKRQIDALRAGTLNELDRMGLLSDGFETAKAGYQSINEYLELLQEYRQERSLPVWETIATSISAIRFALSTSDQDNSLRDAMKPYIRKLVRAEYERLGWDEHKNDTHFDKLLRPLILGLLTGADDEESVAEALKRYEAHVSGSATARPDIRSLLYATAARKGDAKTFESMLKIYKETTSGDEKLALCSGMTNFEQSNIHERVLDLIIDGTVKLQDVGYFIAYSFSNRYSKACTWRWMKDNWVWLKKHLGQDLSFSRMPVYAARTFADQTQLEEYKTFFLSIMEPMLERSYNQGLEMIETFAAWRERDAVVALTWFKSQQS